MIPDWRVKQSFHILIGNPVNDPPNVESAETCRLQKVNRVSAFFVAENQRTIDYPLNLRAAET